jgi:TPR repeat protein
VTQDFTKLLIDALEGNDEALTMWVKYTIDDRFSKEEVQITLETIDKILSTPKSPERANALYLKALWHYLGGKPNYTEAIQLYEEAIALGHPFAMLDRAQMYGKGFGGDINYPKAIELYEKIIKLGKPKVTTGDALSNWGFLVYSGKTGELNEAKLVLATELFEMAIKLENSDAMINLAIMHSNGQCGKVNYTKAKDLLEKAINLGNSRALFPCALMYMEGQGAKKDYKHAFELFEQYKQAMSLEEVYEYWENDNEIRTLYTQIKKMMQYGEEIGGDKGDLVKCYAKFLELKLDIFFMNSICKPPTLEEEKAFKLEFSKLLHSKDKEMQSHRKAWKPIVANILIALTGIGLVAIIAKVTAHAVSSPIFSKNKAFFFAQTQTERLAKKIEKSDQWTFNK